MYLSACRVVLGAGLFCLALAGGERAATAAPPASGLAATAADGLVHQADIFRDCIKVRTCWRTRSGRRACGLAERCRDCKFVRRCRKSTGCQWVESCRWGPPVPPVKQPVP